MDVKAAALNYQTSIVSNTQNMDLGQLETQRQQNLPNQTGNEKLQNDAASELLKNPDVIEQAVEDLKKKLSMLNTQLQIQIDKDTEMVVVKVIDRETKQVIRQIPPEYVLKIAKYLDEIAGLLLNEKA
jgi:flagellar protein FlaG